jgi:hypothetical protein
LVQRFPVIKAAKAEKPSHGWEKIPELILSHPLSSESTESPKYFYHAFRPGKMVIFLDD